MGKDYYAILGVSRNADREEIKRAYKRLAKKYHPDVNKDDPEAEKRFKEVNEAAATLGDEEKRRQYDRLGHEAFTKEAKHGAGPGGFDFSGFGADMDFGDIFESFFGDAFGRRSGSRRRGADLRYDLELSLEEAAFGVKRRITIRREVACPACDGLGGKRVETCGSCHGTGAIRRVQRTPFGLFQTSGPCGTCNGQGQQVKELCTRCDGTGLVEETKGLDVDIPAGVEDSTRLRVPGEGAAGPRGAPAGDLYLFLSVASHDVFQRDGDDIYLSAPITFFQATFGAEVTLPTLDGKAKLKIPAGTQSGTVFRLRGKGIVSLRSRARGDQLVTVQVVTPTRMTKAQERALRDAAQEFGDPEAPQKGLFGRLKEHFG